MRLSPARCFLFLVARRSELLYFNRQSLPSKRGSLAAASVATGGEDGDARRLLFKRQVCSLIDANRNCFRGGD